MSTRQPQPDQEGGPLEDLESEAQALYDAGPQLDADGVRRLTRDGADADRLRRAYLGRFDFRRLALDAALRALFRRLPLSGETQAQDRVLQAFAAWWCECQREAGADTPPPTVMSADQAHLLAYALVLLNTDLSSSGGNHAHSSSAQSLPMAAMSAQAFVDNTRRSLQETAPGDGACPVDDAQLRALYESVRRQPFLLPSQSSSVKSPSGTLDSRQGRNSPKMPNAATLSMDRGDASPTIVRLCSYV